MNPIAFAVAFSENLEAKIGIPIENILGIQIFSKNTNHEARNLIHQQSLF